MEFSSRNSSTRCATITIESRIVERFRIGFLATLWLFAFNGTGAEHSKSAGATPPVVPAPAPALGQSFPAGVSAEDRQQLERDLASLSNKLATLRTSATAARETAKLDIFADADLFQKGLVWALRYELNLATNDITLLQHSAQRGHQRADALLASQTPWTRTEGAPCCAASSRPWTARCSLTASSSRRATTRAKPMRLDVVLHGSTRPVGMSELRFMSRFDEGDEAAQVRAREDFIELHPLGRVENCYRWAGETDVFEAIEAVCRNYPIDRDRIVLRGMSMGASGTWHLGLKHPDRFVALGPYCGYVDTHQFSRDAAAELREGRPAAAAPGEGAAHARLGRLRGQRRRRPGRRLHGREGRLLPGPRPHGRGDGEGRPKMVNLISPGTGHVIDPATHREQMRRIGEYAAKGLDHAPKHSASSPGR